MSPVNKEYCKIHKFNFRSLENDNKDMMLGCHFLNKLPEYSKEPYWQNYCGLLVLSGSGTYKDEDGNIHQLQPGSFAQHLPGKYHLIYRDKSTPWSECSISLGVDLFNMLQKTNIIDTANPVTNPGLDNNLIEEFHSLFLYLQKATNENLSEAFIRAQAILNKMKKPPEKLSINEAKIKQASIKLANSLHEAIDIEELAGCLHLSYSHFRRLFKQHTGLSPAEFRLGKKMEHAKLLLHSNEISIKEIAAEIGYNDSFVFSRQFKKHYGKTPTQEKNS